MFRRLGAGIFGVVLLALPLMVQAEAIMKAVSYPDHWVPLEEVSVTVEVTDQVATTVIDHVFDNRSTTTLPSATYYFPLPAEAAVVGFGIWIDDEVHYFPLEPGDQSGAGGDPLPNNLAEFLGPNPFTETFENLEPGEHTIRLEYTELMPYDFGEYAFVYPHALPEWIDETLDLVSLEINGTSQRELVSVAVENYPDALIENVTADSFRVTYAAENTLPGDPFGVNIEVDQEDVGMWVMTHNDGDEATPGHFLAVVEPGDVDPGDELDKTFTFVIDKSGSMSGAPMAEAKDAAIYCVTHLNAGDYFNVIPFSDSVWPWQPDPVPATEDNILAAVAFIESLSAGGWTRFNDAVLAALNQNVPLGTVNQILVLSDGEPTAGVTDLPTILANIEAANEGGASIFTVAAGADDPEELAFLNYIAYENSGLTLRVETGEDLSDEIEIFFLRFSSPVLAQVELQPDGVTWDEVYPPAPYTLFAGSQIIMAGQYPTSGSADVTMRFTVGGVQDSLSYGPFSFTDSDSTTYGFVPRMWAIRKIDYWLAWMAVYGEDDSIVQMIIDLSLQYGILTPYTDFNTPVKPEHFLTVQAHWERAGVRVQWMLRPAVDGATFHVYRREGSSRTWLRLTSEPVAGTTYLDATAEAGVAYTYRVALATGDVTVQAADVGVRATLPGNVVLRGASPNPFNASTRVRFTLSEAMAVELTVHDILGREVVRLAEGQHEVGEHQVLFDGRDLASGVYFLRLQASATGTDPILRASRMLLLK